MTNNPQPSPPINNNNAHQHHHQHQHPHHHHYQHQHHYQDQHNHHDQEANHPILSKIHTLPKEIRNLLAGGLAGMIAKTVVAPIDRIKILYQVTSAPFRLRDVPKVAYSIIEKEGYSALWKGNLATMMRVFPYSGIQFMVFDRLKMHFLQEKKRGVGDGGGVAVPAQNMAEDFGEEVAESVILAGAREKAALSSPTSTSSSSTTSSSPSSSPPSSSRRKDTTSTKGGLTPLESLIGGMVAGTVSVLCTYPLDLARAQLAVLRKKKKTHATVVSQLTEQTLGKSRSKGLTYVLSNGFRQGGVLGLYRGITPTLLGILPYSGIAFTINEQAKRQITHIMQREPTTFERIQCGALSGLFAQSIAYPLEVTRRRMQTIGIVPTSGSESAAINFMGVAPTLKPSVDELPEGRFASEARAGGVPFDNSNNIGNGNDITRQREMQSPKLNSAGESAGHGMANAGKGGSTTTTTTTTTATTISTTNSTATSSSSSSHHHKPPSMMTTMRHLFEEQGIRGFFKGVSMNWVKGPIAFSISFTAFDTIQGWIETESEREKKQQLTRSAIKRRLTSDDD